jgi:mRNA-degrading endonuclease RelE of RelBE toxin-antitoxin system
MYRIVYVESIAQDLARLRAGERGRVLDAIDVQLSHEPARRTRNRKILIGLVPPWDHEGPVWQLRVGEFRVFYDVSESSSEVVIRAIRHKPRHITTEEIL